MFERFTDRARRVLVLAQEEARHLNQRFIGTEHILLGLIREGEGVAARALEALNISLEAVHAKLEESIGPAGSASWTGSPPFTPRAKKVLELSLREALQLSHNYIGTEHMLLGLIREGEGAAAQVLQQLGADLPRVRQQVIQLLSGYQGRTDIGRRSGRFPGAGLVESPRHPTRVLPGPASQFRPDGTEFRIIGVLFFAEGTRVLWRVSGMPEAVAEALSEHAVFTGAAQLEHPVASVMISDDLDTAYVRNGAWLDLQPNGEWAGSSFFAPAVPDAVSRLQVRWQAEVVSFDLRPAV